MKHEYIYNLLNETKNDHFIGAEELSDSEINKIINRIHFKQAPNKHRLLKPALLTIVALFTLFVINPSWGFDIYAEVNSLLSNVSKTLFHHPKEISSEQEHALFTASEIGFMGDYEVKIGDVYFTGKTLSFSILMQGDEALDAHNAFVKPEGMSLVLNGQPVNSDLQVASGGLLSEEDNSHFVTVNVLIDNFRKNHEIEMVLTIDRLRMTDDQHVGKSAIVIDSPTVLKTTIPEDYFADTIIDKENISFELDKYGVEVIIDEMTFDLAHSRILAELKGNYLDYTYKIKITTDSEDVYYFRQWNQIDTTFTEFILDEYLEIDYPPITNLMNAKSLKMELLQLEGLKGPLEEFYLVGDPIEIMND